MKNISAFISENFQFWVVKFSMYLNRYVFVMLCFLASCLCLLYKIKSYICLSIVIFDTMIDRLCNS